MSYKEESENMIELLKYRLRKDQKWKNMSCSSIIQEYAGAALATVVIVGVLWGFISTTNSLESKLAAQTAAPTIVHKSYSTNQDYLVK